MKVGEVDSSEDDLNHLECLMFNYQPRQGVLGIEVETIGELFWAPIAHRTRKCFKASPTS